MKHIDRRKFIKETGLAASTLLFSDIFAHAEKSNARRPNIVLLMADDLGYGDVDFNGNSVIKTPNLDAMAKNGVRFSHFYAGGPVCSPTRATCLTGRHHHRLGVFSATVGYLPAEEITLARICKSSGYTTGHFGKWHLGALGKTGLTLYEVNRDRKYAPPWERDYDESLVTECNVPTWDPMDNARFKWVFQLPFWYNGKIETENLIGASSRIIMDRAIPFIQQAVQNDKAFFTTIWFHEPHEPVVGGPEYRALYQDCSEAEQHYYGCITAMDEQIGRLRQELLRLGVADNTMIWFCSDNGPEGMSSKGEPDSYRNSRGVTNGLRGRKRSLFCGGVQVPALLEWPGHIQTGSVNDVPCSTLDYFPTIMNILNFKMPDHRPLDGISLLPVLNGKMRKRPKPIPFWYNYSKKVQMHGSPTLGWIDNNLKFLTNFSTSGDEDLLFNLEKDREESTNIIAQYPRIAKKMKAELKKWIKSCQASHSGADYPTRFTPVDPFPELTGTWKDGEV